MGHRDALLRGAKQCLTEKGYARTTARDIVAASGANLASIGYHYGSKEALLNEALIEANVEWGQALKQAVAGGPDSRGAMVHERFEAVWTKVIDLFLEHRGLYAANFEALTQVEHHPEVREALAKGLEEARAGLGEFLLNRYPEMRDELAARAVGSFCQALLTGVMAQLLIDPGSAPTDRDLSLALRLISGDRRAEADGERDSRRAA